MRRAVPILLLLLSACAASPDVFPTPPALPVVKIPLPPVSDVAQVWQPGDWAYIGGSYHYDPGHYIPADSAGSAWVYGHWAGSKDHYVWVPGSWLAPGMR